jgi:hypothetical protein
MKPQDKELLLKDLCSRLPYEVKIHAKYVDTDTNTEVEKVGVLSMVDNDTVIAFTYDDTNCYNYVTIHEVKPYLVPLSSMSEEQNFEFLRTCLGGNANFPTLASFDWLNKNHFDYRGLIPMGLAIDATGLNIYDNC